MDKYVNIVLTGDNNYVMPMGVAMYSVVKNLNSNSIARFFLLVSGWTEKEEAEIRKVQNCEIIIVMKSRGQKAIDAKFPKGLPHSTLVTDRHQSYFNMNVKDHQVCLAHLRRNAEYLNELDTGQDWSRRFIQLISHAIEIRRLGNITKRKTKLLKSKMQKLLGENLTHLDGEFESFKKGILKVKDYLFTFLTDPNVPYDNNASERGVRKIKVKQKVSGCFRTDGGANDFAKIHSIAETAMKNGNSKFNAILAVVQQ